MELDQWMVFEDKGRLNRKTLDIRVIGSLPILRVSKIWSVRG